MAHFFLQAFCLRVDGSTVLTIEQVKRGLKPLREAAHHFRRGADILRDVGLEESVPEAERIATRCEIRAARLAFDDDDPALVKRHRGYGDVRWYCRSLATTNITIFGKSLVGTVSTVATVAFDREVRHRSVQEWCAGLPG
jgi:hypothetical protein